MQASNKWMWANQHTSTFNDLHIFAQIKHFFEMCYWKDFQRRKGHRVVWRVASSFAKWLCLNWFEQGNSWFENLVEFYYSKANEAVDDDED